MKNHSKLLTGLVMGALLTGCASQGAQQEKPVDPWEGFNRKVFAFNDTLDRYALKPVAKGYDTITPDPIQTGVGNFFSNLGELRTVLNSVLQWKWNNAGIASGRFLVNTTLGLGGVLDPASRMEWMAREEDFGQTLGVWGVAEGPYVVLPLLGSSTVRDTSALPVDWYTYPLTYVEEDSVRYAIRALQLVNVRASLLEQEKLISGDRYVFLRDTYLQLRRFEVNDGRTGDDPFASDDFDFNDSDFAD
ncbi:VacJ family lipoprotein [Halomonas sp. M20]|uniref:MlaA family lipoprotein n=1 Tax=Halomonas sp. M20 TaxID=2763264 RepID=UPI001D0A4FDB|nr:VacJ family lipoprotein [Halomonas sp. M20]